MPSCLSRPTVIGSAEAAASMRGVVRIQAAVEVLTEAIAAHAQVLSGQTGKP